MIPSYGKVYAIGHAAIKDLFDGHVIGEEKIDGSQFSFMRKDRELYCRSRNQEICPDAPPNDFAPAVEAVLERFDKLHDGWIYRGEVLARPKHNVLCYDQVPEGNIALFDVDTGNQDYLTPEDKQHTAFRLGLGWVPVLFRGVLEDIGQLDSLLDQDSCLGGTKIEGIVFKAHGRYGRDGKTLMGKYVSERFKEVHGKDWKCRHPGKKEVRQELIEKLRTEARWDKAVQHLRDRGQLQEAPQDIGPLIREIMADVSEECQIEVKEYLWLWIKKDLMRGVTSGFPEWYKRKLAEGAFHASGD